MGAYVLRRVIQAIPLLFGITLLTFVIVNLVPGSPLVSIERELGIRRMRPEDIERITKHFGLDRPVHERYFAWVGNLVRGDLGFSLRNFRPVSELILHKLPNTLLLTTSAFLLALLLAIPTGVYGAVRRNSVFDHVTTAAAVAGYSVPIFWLGLMLLLVFAVKFKEWGLPSLPAGGAVDLRGGGGVRDRIEHLILPVITLAFVQVAYWSRFIRSQMLEVLGLDYVRTARAKGLTERTLIFRHGLRNAILPLVTLLGLSLPSLFGGALITEQIFSYPGIGQLAFNAAVDKDYPLIMGTVLFAAVLVVLGNLLADIAYSLLDPRIRLVQ
jgi:peptide/nickel transport system permease protein